MNLTEWVGAGWRDLVSLTRCVRLRAGKTVDPYDPETLLGEDWGNPERLVFEGFIASGSSVDVDDPVRRRTSTRKVLTVFDPGVDIVRGDRVEVDGVLFRVEGIHANDVNPWTGWQPTRVIELEVFEG